MVQEAFIDCILQQPVKLKLDWIPTVQEIAKTIDQLKHNKITGFNSIFSEIYKYDGPALHVQTSCFFY